LLSGQMQLDALDAFGHLRDLRQTYLRQYEQWRAGQHRLDELLHQVADRERREDLLRYQSRELDEADLRDGEEELLAVERQRLTHARRLKSWPRKSTRCSMAAIPPSPACSAASAAACGSCGVLTARRETG